MTAKTLTLCLGFILTLTGLMACGKKKPVNAPGATASAAGAGAGAGAAPAQPKLCANGQAPKVQIGLCTGAWRVKPSGKGMVCEFEWSPPIKCPNGMKGLAYQTVCYGVNSKPPSAKVKNTADCIAEFGKFPISPNYTLECCS